MTTLYKDLIKGHSGPFKKLILIFAFSANFLISPCVTCAMEREESKQTVKKRKLNIPLTNTESLRPEDNSSPMYGEGLSKQIRCVWTHEENPQFLIHEVYYEPKDIHKKLYQKVRPVLDVVKQPLIAQLYLIVEYSNKEGKDMHKCIPYLFSNPNGDELLFVSGSKGKKNIKGHSALESFYQVDYNTLQSLLQIKEKDIFKWFVEIYWDFKNARKNLENSFFKGSNQSHGRDFHHTEQWLGIYLWYKTVPILKEILGSRSEVKKVCGMTIPFYSLNDVCECCQEMWHYLMKKLPEKIKKHWDQNFLIELAEDFFILPIASSSQFYVGGGRLSPVTLEMREKLRKLNMKVNVKGPQFLSRKQLNFLQYTTEYENFFKERTQSIGKEYKDIAYLYGKGIFPCVWVPEESSLRTLAQKTKELKTKQLSVLFTTKKGIPVLNSHWNVDEIIKYVSAPSLNSKASNLYQLTHLDLSLGGLTQDEAEIVLNNLFFALPFLNSLKIKDFDEVAPLVKNVRGFTSLETLKIKNNDDITHREIKSLSVAFPNIKHLSLFSWIMGDEQGLMNDEDEWVQDKSIIFLAKSLAKLESLSFQAYMITDKAMHTIAKYLTNLRALEASVFYCTNKSLKYLAKLSLEKLSLYQMATADDDLQGDIDDEGANFVAVMTSLRSLKLDRYKISNNGFIKLLISLPSLTTLDVARNSIGDEGGEAAINFLKTHQNFSKLELFGNSMSAKMKKELLKFPQCASNEFKCEAEESDSSDEEEDSNE